MPKRQSGNKKNRQNNFAKLSIFQPNKYRFKKNCPLSIKGAPTIDYKNIKLLKKYISENKRLSDGLDRISKDDDIDTDKYRIITGSSEDTQNVYICPRIYCVRCMVPIKIDDFIKDSDYECIWHMPTPMAFRPTNCATAGPTAIGLSRR